MRDKQIKEMSEVITTVMNNRCWHNDCTMCEFESENHCQFDLLATALVEDYGYRKASKIFEEIEKKVKASITVHLEELNKEHIQDTPLYDRHSGIIFALRGIDDFITELKKKYESEEK